MSAVNAPRALISIGTNSTRLLILDGERVATAQSIGTRLGRGLDLRPDLDPAAVELTLNTIRAYTADVRARRATVDAIATSALRRAANAAGFVDKVEAITGVTPRILSGDEEATYSFLGATAAMQPAQRVGVLDVGGGSTELAVGTATAIERTVSLEIGAVRLCERFPALLGERALDDGARARLVCAARDAARAVLQPLVTFTRFADLIAVGGTVFTAAAMLSGDASGDGVRITAEQRRETIGRLLERDIQGRRELAHIRPQRADILAGGLIVVDVACELLEIDALRVSHADLLAGYLRSSAYRAQRVR